METTAAEVMTRDVLTVRDDLSVAELAAFFETHRISGAPVTSAEGIPVGVVSLSDLARSSVVRSSLTEEPHDFYVRGLERFISEEEKLGFRVYSEASTLVRDIMTPEVFSLDETSSVGEVAQAMLTGRIHRVFVTRAGQIVGIVSAMDLLRLVRDMA